jgi:hypothetical protein
MVDHKVSFTLNSKMTSKLSDLPLNFSELENNLEKFEDVLITSNYKLHSELTYNVATNDLHLYLASGASLSNVQQQSTNILGLHLFWCRFSIVDISF